MAVLPLRSAPNGTVLLTLEERNRILLDHVFGVDLDPQAVEVTKLSLLLEAIQGEPKAVLDTRTRRGESALPDLGKNILCGNSLLGTDFLVGKKLNKVERAELNCFDWAERFPEAHATGGFDAVIGNPPYVRQEKLGAAFKEYAAERFRAVHHGVADLYVYFVQRSHELLKPGGRFGMICSNKWMRANYGRQLREYLAKNTTLREVVDFGELRVFQDAATFPAILLTENASSKRQQFVYAPVKRLEFSSLENEVQAIGQRLDEKAISGGNWALAAMGEIDIFEKMKSVSMSLDEYTRGDLYRGIITGLSEAFVVDATTKKRLIAEDKRSRSLIKPFVVGDDVRKYHINFRDRHLILIPKGWTDKASKGAQNPWNWFRKNYPALAEHLAPFEKRATKRQDKGDYWWELRACDYYDKFELDKIVIPDIAKESRIAFDTKKLYTSNTCYFIPISDMYLLGLLNSKLMFAYFKRKAAVLGDADKGGRLRWFRQDVLKLPIRQVGPKDKEGKKLQKQIQLHVEQILERNRELADEWKAPDQERLKGEIGALNRKIDELVYELYGLTEEEIGIVEGEK